MKAIRWTAWVVLLVTLIASAQSLAKDGAPDPTAVNATNAIRAAHLAEQSVLSTAPPPAGLMAEPALKVVPPTAAINPSKGKSGIARDPFLRPRIAIAEELSCSSGKRCLAIEDITVRGVIRSDGRVTALVVNGANQVYFLHEKDAVRNGWVSRIDGNSVVFRTHAVGAGTTITRDVIKMLSGGPDA